MALCLYTAQRRSDVVRMGRQHLIGGVLSVQQVRTKPKLGIPLHDDLLRIIDPIPANQMVFLLTDYGKAFTPNGFYMRMKEWVEQAGLPKGRSPHGLRKAACRRLAEAGCSEDQIAAISGHLDVNEIRTYVRAANQLKMAKLAMRHLGTPIS